MSRLTRLSVFAVTLAVCALPSPSLFAQETPEVEMVTWWDSPGENAALGVIKQAVEQQGGLFNSKAIQERNELRSHVLKRQALGYPPAVTQWLGGKDLIQLNKLGAIQTLPDTWKGKALSDILVGDAYNPIAPTAANQTLAALPVGIHIQNTAYFSSKIYRELDLPIPTSWQMFLQQAEKIRAAGYIPLATSDQSWQLRRLFSAILIETLGAEQYLPFYNPQTDISQWREEIIKVMDIYLQLRQHADPGATKRRWFEASLLVGEHKAAMQVMGDWVKGELMATGLKPGEDFFCGLAPGANDKVFTLMDTFLMLKVKEPHLQAGQKLLFELVLSPETQTNFAQKKGGIPVRRDVDSAQLDECSAPLYQKVILGESIAERETISRLRFGLLEKVIYELWHDDKVTPEQAAGRLIATYKGE